MTSEGRSGGSPGPREDGSEATMIYLGQGPEPDPTVDEDAPILRHPPTLIVRLEGGPRSGDITLCLADADLIFPDGSVYCYA